MFAVGKCLLFNYSADTWGLVRALFGSLRRILLFMHPIKLQIESDRRTQYGLERIRGEILLGTLGGSSTKHFWSTYHTSTGGA